MENLHNSVMINEIISFLPLKKSINVIDATFGGGGYSKTILEKFNVNQLLAIDRDPISKIFAKELEIKFPNFTTLFVIIFAHFRAKYKTTRKLVQILRANG